MCVRGGWGGLGNDMLLVPSKEFVQGHGQAIYSFSILVYLLCIGLETGVIVHA